MTFNVTTLNDHGESVVVFSCSSRASAERLVTLLQEEFREAISDQTTHSEPRQKKISDLIGYLKQLEEMLYENAPDDYD
jgi:hypothetical protein